MPHQELVRHRQLEAVVAALPNPVRHSLAIPVPKVVRRAVVKVDRLLRVAAQQGQAGRSPHLRIHRGPHRATRPRRNL
jgi:hypothetical protein